MTRLPLHVVGSVDAVPGGPHARLLPGSSESEVIPMLVVPIRVNYSGPLPDGSRNGNRGCANCGQAPRWTDDRDGHGPGSFATGPVGYIRVAARLGAVTPFAYRPLTPTHYQRLFPIGTHTYDFGMSPSALRESHRRMPEMYFDPRLQEQITVFTKRISSGRTKAMLRAGQKSR